MTLISQIQSKSFILKFAAFKVRNKIEETPRYKSFFFLKLSNSLDYSQIIDLVWLKIPWRTSLSWKRLCMHTGQSESLSFLMESVHRFSSLKRIHRVSTSRCHAIALTKEKRRECKWKKKRKRYDEGWVDRIDGRFELDGVVWWQRERKQGLDGRWFFRRGRPCLSWIPFRIQLLFFLQILRTHQRNFLPVPFPP